MKIIESFLTKNNCYIAGKKITVKGLMLHSVGVGQPKAEVFVKNWNVPKPDNREVCVHAFLEPDNVYQTLPWEYRGWHDGGAANNSYIGVEMTEPGTIKYSSGANFVDNDPAASEKHVFATYKTAVELFAFLCQKYDLDPFKDIISHSEGNKLGIASPHADPEHLWKKFGLTMDAFRVDVKAELAKISNLTPKPPVPENPNSENPTPEEPTPEPENPKKLYKVQVGAFANKANAEKLAIRLKNSGFGEAYIKYE
jgi:cell division septation protein DedD